MRIIILLTFILLSSLSFGQTYRFVDAPIGFLRDEPKITANILVRLEERTRVKIIEQISRNWSKVEYVYNSRKHVGYITNHTLSEESIIRKKKAKT